MLKCVHARAVPIDDVGVIAKVTPQDTTALSIQQWLICLAVALTILIVSEIWNAA